MDAGTNSPGTTDRTGSHYQGEDFGDVPDAMRLAKRWLVWRSVRNGSKKPKKVPHYVSGACRSGDLDTHADLDRLATFDEALAALNAGRYDGLGFALGPDSNGGCWQGIDLDRTNERPELQLLVDDLPGYVEASPSGCGVHAIGYGRWFACLTPNESGIEAYASGRFFTVTGEGSGLGEPIDIADFVDRVLRPAHSPRATEEAEHDDPIEEVPAETIDDLRSALAFMRADADHYGPWIANGQRLKRLGECGYALWIEWGQTSPKFDAVDSRRRWNGFTADRTGYRAIFAEAQRRGWVNPRKGPEPTINTGGISPAAVSPCTHRANSHRIAKQFGERLMYVHGMGWYVWQSHGPWKLDELAALQVAAGVANVIQREAVELTELAAQADPAMRDRLNEQAVERMKWAKASESLPNITAGLTLTKPLLAQPPAALNGNAELLGTPSGVIDLRTGEIREHRPQDRITQTTAVDPDFTADHPQFDRLLARLFPGESGTRVVEFLRRWFGYCLTGHVYIALLMVWQGDGCNGKSTLATLLRRVMGMYAGPAAPALLKAHQGERHPTETAGLQGQRMAVIAEWEQGDRLNEGLVKQLTGGDAISTRKMYQDFYSFEPSHKLLLFANHTPRIQGSDPAIWRRIALVRFEQTIREDEKDPDIDAKLWAEAGSVLAWGIDGARDFLASGLPMPDEVKAATQRYRADSDVIGRFISECCDLDLNGEQEAGDLFAAYRSWCAEEGEKPASQKVFGSSLTERGHGTTRASSGRAVRIGLALNELGKTLRTRWNEAAF